MKTVIFGANGSTGQLLTRHALDAGHAAVAVTRRPESFPLHPLAAHCRRRRRTGCVHAHRGGRRRRRGAVHAGGEIQPQAHRYLLAGTRNIVAAMHETGVRRLVVVSSTNVGRRRNIPLMLRLVEPIITRTIGKTLYDDLRRMEAIVRDSGLDWTTVRPSLLFDLPRPTNYVAGEVAPVGPFTARIDLADYMLALASQAKGHNTVIISTVEHTPPLWQTIRREAAKSA